jgi:histone H3/H4
MAKKPEKAEKVDAFFVKSKVRDYIKNKGCNTSSGVLDGGALNMYITWYLDKAIERAQANGRKTVKARDL